MADKLSKVKVNIYRSYQTPLTFIQFHLHNQKRKFLIPKVQTKLTKFTTIFNKKSNVYFLYGKPSERNGGNKKTNEGGGLPHFYSKGNLHWSWIPNSQIIVWNIIFSCKLSMKKTVGILALCMLLSVTSSADSNYHNTCLLNPGVGVQNRRQGN